MYTFIGQSGSKRLLTQQYTRQIVVENSSIMSRLEKNSRLMNTTYFLNIQTNYLNITATCKENNSVKSVNISLIVYITNCQTLKF